MGRSNLRELRSRLVVLLVHLLKWQMQPVGRTNSWSATIAEQRRRIRRLMRRAPGVRPLLAPALAEAYDDARANAATEAGLAVEIFPPACPYTADQVLSATFLPD